MFNGKFDSLKHQKAFEEWAFGETPIVYNDFLRLSWNSHHGDLLEVKIDENIGNSMGMMLLLHKAYMEGYQAAEQDAEEEEDESDEEAAIKEEIGKKLDTLQAMLRG